MEQACACLKGIHVSGTRLQSFEDRAFSKKWAEINSYKKIRAMVTCHLQAMVHSSIKVSNHGPKTTFWAKIIRKYHGPWLQS